MPKVASYRLAWSFTDQAYQLQETREQAQLQIVPESPAWFAWLDQVSSFAFRGQRGHYTARKESRPRGEAYWYAYVGAGNRLGKTTDVTLAAIITCLPECCAEGSSRSSRRWYSSCIGAPAPGIWILARSGKLSIICCWRGIKNVSRM